MGKLENFLERKRVFFRFLIVIAVLGVAVVGYYFHIMGAFGDTPQILVFGGFVAFYLFFVALIYVTHRMLYVRDIPIERLFLFSIIVMGIVYTFVFPPFTIPDETVHYMSAYKTSNHLLFHFKNVGEGSLLMRQGDLDFFANYSSRISAENYINTLKATSIFCRDTALVTAKGSFSTSVPFGYVAPAIGIALARILHLGAVPAFFMGRLFNVALYTTAVYYAIKKAPVGKIVFFVISLLPMSLHLVGSYSYDTYINAIAFLFMAQFIYLYCKETPITTKDVILLAVFGILLAPSKLVYSPLVFLAILLPNKNFASRKVCWISKLAVIGAGVLSLAAFQFSALLHVAPAAKTVSWTGEPGYTLSWLLDHPLGAVMLFFRTIIMQGDFHLETMTGRYVGWFQIAVNSYVHVFFLVLLLLSFIKPKGEKQRTLSVLGRSYSFIVVAASAVLIAMSMLLNWTPMSYIYIAGIQGRYYIPLLPAIYLMIRNSAITVKDSFYKHIAFLLIPANAIFLLEVLSRVPAA